MEQERFMVIDNQKGVVIPLQAEQSLSFKGMKDRGAQEDENTKLEEKVNKMQALIKVLIKQSIKDTINEYNLQLTEELKEYEYNEIKRWERLEENELKRWERFEGKMEEHFKFLDKNIRQKQDESKRKKHSIF